VGFGKDGRLAESSKGQQDNQQSLFAPSGGDVAIKYAPYTGPTKTYRRGSELVLDVVQCGLHGGAADNT